LHAETFSGSARASLRCIAYSPTAETTSAQFPFVLNSGRSLYQFNAGTMTMRTRNRVLRPTDQIDMCPSDAARLDLHDGDRVRVTSRQGEAILPLHFDGNVTAGELFATFSDRATWLNALTGSLRDPHTGTPEFKVTAVRVEKA
jgi:formate dehydrogenase major subunit